MAKRNNRKKLEPIIESVVNETNGQTVATIRMVEKRYKMVPFDLDTHADFIELCVMRGFGKRGQGAMARVLVRDALAKTRAELGKLK